MFPAATMAHCLKTQLFNQFQDTRDNEGKSLFLPDAEKTIDLQIKNAEYIKDPPNDEMYRTVPPGPKLKHKLPQYFNTNHSSAPQVRVQFNRPQYFAHFTQFT
jgi:hypothetical protein